MEVHHHPEVEKKGFKEYILEGLMIFLAVMMGFIAENVREGISDKAKGKEYIRSFVEDLRRDTGNFSRLIIFDEKKSEVLNTLSTCFDTIGKQPEYTSCLVPIVNNSLSNRGATFTEGTMQQLKNAGGFRLLNAVDKDSILTYDHEAHAYLDFQATVFQESQNDVRNTFRVIWNFKANAFLSPAPARKAYEIPLLISNDKVLINQFFNNLFFYKRVNASQIRIIKNLQKQATGLIKYFENKYDLANE